MGVDVAVLSGPMAVEGFCGFNASRDSEFTHRPLSSSFL